MNSDPYLRLYAYKDGIVSPVLVYNRQSGRYAISDPVDRISFDDRPSLASLILHRKTQPVQIVGDWRPKNDVASLIGVPDLAEALSKSLVFDCIWYQDLRRVDFSWRGPIHIRTERYKEGVEKLPLDTPDSYFIDRIYEVVQKFKKEIN
jgi:hypothetical protein